VIIQSRPMYVDEDAAGTEVASCDIYERVGEVIERLTSYNVGLT
jgi:hypothetical protein